MQRDRRNLSDAEMYACILEIDKRSSLGGKRVRGSGGPVIDPKHKTASIVGTSANKVQKVRTISDHAPAEVKEGLRKGDLSINQAYTKTQQLRKTKPTLPSSPSPSTPTHSTDSSPASPATFTIMDELASSNRIVIT
jgi:hypothetical protein